MTFTHWCCRLWREALPGWHAALAGLVFVIITAAPASAQTSPHGSLSFACEQCHTSASWKEMARPMKFDHGTTGFPLKGQHAIVQCRACHTSLAFSRTPAKCADCHDDVHRGELGTLCDRCHSPQSWLVADMVQKHARTRFALVGAHATASCQLCHTNQQKYEYVNVRTDCFGCHAADYQATSNPNHLASGLSTDCVQCHSITSNTWGTNFDHAKTGFPLIGAHRAIPCIQCHVGAKFRGASAQCFSCHQKDYQATKNPTHSPGIPTDCASCHSSTAWQPATFNHGKTAFPLTGTHVTTACMACHKTGLFAGTPTTCGNTACHLSDYNATASPAHAQAAISLECQTCHTTTAWRPATFDHSKTAFVLTGAHATIACASCHKNGVFAGTPATCGNVACHLTDYNNTTNPAHASAGFNTDCQSCHTTAAWKPATFNHDPFFPISAGSRHSPGRWTACADCHTVPTDYKVFSCINCHTHSNKATVDGQHVGRTGYTYTPTSCYTCHPRGTAG
jgi:hypothetical protein